jgi:tetratricopeptide (TPR) repeat protein
VNRTRANSPALYYLETRNWKAAEALRPDPTSEPYNQAITFWAQAIAAGHLHDSTAAQNAVVQYDEMLEFTKKGTQERVAKFMTTRQDEAHAWLLALRGKDDEAVTLLRNLATRQDIEGKGEIEIPAREMLADMLMEMNRPAEALVEYERSLKIEPNKFNGLYGTAQAAELLGDRNKAKIYFEQLSRNCVAARSKRPELLYAREVTEERKR